MVDISPLNTYFSLFMRHSTCKGMNIGSLKGSDFKA